MKKLYNALREVFIQSGYNVAEWGQDTIEPIDRTLRIEVVYESQI